MYQERLCSSRQGNVKSYKILHHAKEYDPFYSENINFTLTSVSELKKFILYASNSLTVRR